MMVMTICLSSGRADHGPHEGGAQTQEGQPGAGTTGDVQQGGEQEHLEQVCASQAWLMLCEGRHLAGKPDTDCFGHTAEVEGSCENLAHWCNCFQLPMQSSKRRRTNGMSTSEVNKIDRWDLILPRLQQRSFSCMQPAYSLA